MLYKIILQPRSIRELLDAWIGMKKDRLVWVTALKMKFTNVLTK
jgi:hypothetical protein